MMNAGSEGARHKNRSGEKVNTSINEIPAGLEA